MSGVLRARRLLRLEPEGARRGASFSRDHGHRQVEAKARQEAGCRGGLAVSSPDALQGSLEAGGGGVSSILAFVKRASGGEGRHWIFCLYSKFSAMDRRFFSVSFGVAPWKNQDFRISSTRLFLKKRLLVFFGDKVKVGIML